MGNQEEKSNLWRLLLNYLEGWLRARGGFVGEGGYRANGGILNAKNKRSRPGKLTPFNRALPSLSIPVFFSLSVCVLSHFSKEDEK